MNWSRELLVMTFCLATAAALPGCGTWWVSPPPPPPGPESVHDPCADRLGELCEGLLLYYSGHGELPESLTGLAQTASRPAVPPTCPTSGKPYVYNPDGLEMPGRSERLIVYDPEPSHAGTRRAVMAVPARPGNPLVLTVIRVPEAAVVWQKPQPNP
jgi:hypothetical protein